MKVIKYEANNIYTWVNEIIILKDVISYFYLKRQSYNILIEKLFNKHVFTKNRTIYIFGRPQLFSIRY